MSVVDGVKLELEMLAADRAPGAAALALAMAERIDGGKGSPSECGKVALAALQDVRSLTPPVQTRDGLDDLKAQRAKRLGRVAGAADQPGS